MGGKPQTVNVGQVLVRGPLREQQVPDSCRELARLEKKTYCSLVLIPVSGSIHPSDTSIPSSRCGASLSPFRRPLTASSRARPFDRDRETSSSTPVPKEPKRNKKKRRNRSSSSASTTSTTPRRHKGGEGKEREGREPYLQECPSNASRDSRHALVYQHQTLDRRAPEHPLQRARRAGICNDKI